jgi:hypothetical protein
MATVTTERWTRYDSTDAGDDGGEGHELARPADVEHGPEGGHEGGAVADERVVGDEAHQRGRDGDVEHRAGPGADDRDPADVAARIVDPGGAHGCALDADEGEEGHAGEVDGVVEAAAGGVEQAEVRGRDEEPADDADEQQGTLRRSCRSTVVMTPPGPGRTP